MLLQETLSFEGYTVETAASGQEALRQVQRELPDLVLLDIKMPGINGFELRQKLMEINKNINIVIISGYTDQQEVKEIITQGFVNYVLTKPFDLQELKRVVDNLL
jgi:Response regulator containing CheY-like receiver, AAA-type ATPase, and DNA-binding domains